MPEIAYEGQSPPADSAPWTGPAVTEQLQGDCVVSEQWAFRAMDIYFQNKLAVCPMEHFWTIGISE